MKRKKITLSTKLIILLVSIILLLGIFYFLRDTENNNINVQTFSIEDKTWIEDNKNKVINIEVLNNLPVFGIDGVGVFHTFLTDFSTATNLEFNKIATYDSNSNSSNYSFSIKNKIEDDDLVFYIDNYTVFHKDTVVYNKMDFLDNKIVGILAKDYDNLSYYFSNMNFKTFENIDDLIKYYNKTEFEEEEQTLDYILIPYMQNLDAILNNNYNVAYRINDISIYYTLSLSSDNDKLNTIFTKYFTYWKNSNMTKVYNEFLLTKLKKTSSITDADFKIIDSKAYVYGYVKNLPYDTSSDDDIIGINSYYINDFAKLLGITINKKEYNNYNDLKKAIDSGNIDIYFDYSNIETDNYNKLYSHIKNKYIVLKTSENTKSINSFLALSNEKLIMLENSKQYNYFSTNLSANIKTVNNVEKLVADENEFIIVDNFTYDYYKNTIFKDYYQVYEDYIDNNYSYMIKKDYTNLFILFNDYIKTINNSALNTKGFNLLFETNITQNSNSTILLVIIILSLILIAYIIYLINRKVKAKLGTKNYDKIKYMDALTSLKNRNYLNVNMSKWDLNSVYPQAIIMIDLNNIKIINDTYGHEKGDAVIGYAANILINNQIENTDIIRTDGNEFLIYLVGYSEKQIITYIRKLYKLFSSLPHNYGASLGYSMRLDDLKTIEDTINEASIGMRNNKKLTKRN